MLFQKSPQERDDIRRLLLGPALYGLCVKGGGLTQTLLEDRMEKLENDPSIQDWLAKQGIEYLTEHDFLTLCEMKTGSIRADIFERLPLSESVGLEVLEQQGVPKDVIDYVMAERFAKPKVIFGFTKLQIPNDVKIEMLDKKEVLQDFVDTYYHEGDEVSVNKLYKDLIEYVDLYKVDIRDEADIRNSIPALTIALKELDIVVKDDGVPFPDESSRFDERWRDAMSEELVDDISPSTKTINEGYFRRCLEEVHDEYNDKWDDDDAYHGYTYDSEVISKQLPLILDLVNKKKQQRVRTYLLDIGDEEPRSDKNVRLGDYAYEFPNPW